VSAQPYLQQLDKSLLLEIIQAAAVRSSQQAQVPSTESMAAPSISPPAPAE
jgi:hypothetical protein